MLRSSAAKLITAVLLALPAAHASADIYRFVAPDGHVFLTDRPPHKGYKLVLRSRESNQPASSVADNRKRFRDLVQRSAQAASLSPELVDAVILMESAYDPRATSKKGAVGLMQLMPAPARRFGVTDRHDPEQNVSGGTRYLRELLDRFDRDLRLALAAYNAGENAVESYGKQIPPYRETREYVRKVLDQYRRNIDGPG